jgi:hypothetical protein
MAANRPRPSLIKLFDPLANSANSSETPSTPQHRDATDADKENVNINSPFNRLTMTMFVNQISKPSPHPQPASLKRRLVDIGDMTLEDASCPDALLDESVEDEFSASLQQTSEEDENATLTFKDMVKAATPLRKLKTVLESPTNQSSPLARLPLSDIVWARAISVPLPEANDEFALAEKPSEELKTECGVLEGALSDEHKPQGANIPGLVIAPFLAPEDIPLPSSPTMVTQDLRSESAIDKLPDQGPLKLERAEAPFDSNLRTDMVTTPITAKTMHNDSNNDSGGKNDAENIRLIIADQRIPSELRVSLETPSLHISSNDLSPAANGSDSSEFSDASSADTSVPITLLQSSPPSSPISSHLESKPEPADTVSPLPRLRPNPPMPSDNRVSVDLHASFQMHMQSEGMSFDLLSDKVSFLGAQGGMESFSTTTEDDPSFDLETERINMEKALKKCSDAKADKKNKVPPASDSELHNLIYL